MADRLYELVASDVAGHIRAGLYPVGTRLPSERDLAVLFRVSRPTIREAMITLEVDGLVEVRKGSGVYVLSAMGTSGAVTDTMAGPFELIEARQIIEAEVCALAAKRMTKEDLADLEILLGSIEAGSTFEESERADRAFHLKIADCAANSAMRDVVIMLWDAREASPQYRLLAQKAHEAGVRPIVRDHARILDGLRERDAEKARGAMKMHLARVSDSLLAITEAEPGG